MRISGALVLFLNFLISNSQDFYDLDPSRISETGSSYRTEKEGDCICDLTNSGCDKYCCCDSDCTTVEKNFWRADKKCYDRLYTRTELIPLCSERKFVPSITDLYIGLRMVFGIIQSLLCVTFKNIDYSTKVIVKSGNDEINRKVGPRQSYLNESLYSVQEILPIIYKLEGTEFKAFTIPDEKLGIVNECLEENVLFMVDKQMANCHHFYQNPQSMCSANSRVDPKSYYGFKVTTTPGVYDVEVALGAVYTAEQNMSISSNSLTSAGDIKYNSTENSCSNFVSKVIYSIEIDKANYGKILSAKANLVIVKSLKFTSNDPFELEMGIAIQYNAGNYTSKRVSNIGYNTGDYLVAGKTIFDSTSNKTAMKSYYPFFTLDRVSSQGLCYKNYQNQTLSYDKIAIKFGEDSLLSCSKLMNLEELKNYCYANEVYQENLFLNILNQMQYLGIYGNSNPLYIKVRLDTDNIPEQTGIEQPQVKLVIRANCVFDFPTILVYYSSFGIEIKYQYKINSAEIQLTQMKLTYPSTDYTGRHTVTVSLFIQFIEVKNNLQVYVAPPPKLKVYMNNDVLYPFYVAGSKNLEISSIFLFIVLMMLIIP